MKEFYTLAYPVAVAAKNAYEVKWKVAIKGVIYTIMFLAGFAEIST